MKSAIPLTRDLVLLGGGHAHALVLRKWGMAPLAGVRLTLINPQASAPYTGMLPGHVAGHYEREDLDIDLVRLARHAGARLVLDRAVDLDLERKRVKLAGRPDIAYDILSIDIGITSDLPSLPGFAQFAVGAKPLGAFADAWMRFVDAVGTGLKPPTVAVIGAGLAGAELAMAMAHRLAAVSPVPPKVTLIEAEASALRGVGRRTRKAVLAALAGEGILLRAGACVVLVEESGAVLADGTKIDAGFIVGAVGARPHGWLETTGLSLRDGFITVDETLRAIGHQNVFAVGDCADMADSPRPKAGVFAVRQAPVLLVNLKAALSSGPPQPFRPQRDFLKLISLGRRTAIADKYGLALKGDWLWRRKDRIDQAFMTQFRSYPVMPGSVLPAVVADGVRDAVVGGEPLCGGCGSKVSSRALAAGLLGLPPPRRADVVSGAGDDAATLRHGRGLQVITTDHLRAFVDDPWMMARIAATHALSDVWAMGAHPQVALASVILPEASPAMHADMLREIMAGASEVFTAAGADMVGGHTSIGAELTLGFTVTGLCDERVIGIDGARPGDGLILTKPIGTGVILAADMRGLARGADVVAAHASMARSQGVAASILAQAASAMTDVTGFGLAGHLLAILTASQVAARLNLDAVEYLGGAEAAMAAGVRSTIWQGNLAIEAALSRPAGARSDLLFDPQTGGGLLACVPQDKVRDVMKQLADAGEPARLIGQIEPGAPFIQVI